MARHHWINLLLVGRPESRPVHVDHVTARSLSDDEVSQRLHRHASSAYTTNGWHSGVIPTPHGSSIHQFSQLTFRQEGLDKVDSGKVPHVNLAQAKSIKEPLILRVSVGVFGRSQGMGDALVAIDHGAGEIVHGIDFPRVSSAVVGILNVATVDNGVSHSLVRVVRRNRRANAMRQTLLGSQLHLLENSQVLINSTVATLRRNTIHSLGSHSLLVGVVGICLAHGNKLLAHFVQVLKIVGRVSHGIGLNSHERKILDN